MRSRRWVLVLVTPLFALAACGSGSSTSSSSSSSTTIPQVTNPAQQRKPVQPTTVQPGTKIDVLGSISKHSSVAAGNWADPFALTVGDEVYSYATNTAGVNIPVARTNSTVTASICSRVCG